MIQRWMATLILLQVGIYAPAWGGQSFDLKRITLPDGFRISIFADDLLNARSLSAAANGLVFVGSRRAGRVYALVDGNRDGVAERRIIIADGLDTPNGVAYRDGDLYVAENHRILRFADIASHLAPGAPFEVVNDSFPDDGHHGWKFIRFGPDGRLYVPVGAPCNVCLKSDRRYASIMRMNIDGSGLAIFAEGVRNTVGFDWHPRTAELWFTDNGRDWMGDDRPPDELNRAPSAGDHFGFPFFHGNQIPDPVFAAHAPDRQFRPPVQELAPHAAALGMRFYTGSMFPEAYRDQIFIAEHGSWNRSEPIGYRVSVVRLDGDRAVAYEVFASGWLGADGVIGRPVDVEVLDDGSLLVSDDHAGNIYRIVYRP